MFEAIIICFSPDLGIGSRGLTQGIGTQPAHAAFHRGQLKLRSFGNLFFFDTVTTQNDHPVFNFVVLETSCRPVYSHISGHCPVGGGGTCISSVYELIG